jgi:hypothetical protein
MFGESCQFLYIHLIILIPHVIILMKTLNFRMFGESRQFLYIHLIILILHVISLIGFMITVYCLVSHWAEMSTVQRLAQ